jgi:TIR domain
MHQFEQGPEAMNVFLSHKKQFFTQANELNAALKLGVPGATIFQSEDIGIGAEWVESIDRALDQAKCFVLLYASPEQDWKWCFYEAGRFSHKEPSRRPVTCLHPKAVDPPNPLANLQAVVATQDNIQKWLKGDFFRGVRSHEPTRRELDHAVTTIEKLVNGMPTGEQILKPYIWIAPKAVNDWSNANNASKIDFTHALVEIDGTSARSLGFADPPNIELLPFLRRIACDTNGQPGQVEFWITKFFESLQSAVNGNTIFQEEAYFRHESGTILRPVVVSYARCASGTVCKLRVIFAEAFGSPLTDSPGLAQRLSIGARLAIRTRLEILDPFVGRVSQMQQEKSRSTRDEDEVGRTFKIGTRLVEVLGTIIREADSHGVRSGDPAPILFAGADQLHYEEIRHRTTQGWSKLQEEAKEDDRRDDYTETERLLNELKQTNEDYLALVLPRIEELLVPAEKRRPR